MRLFYSAYFFDTFSNLFDTFSGLSFLTNTFFAQNETTRTEEHLISIRHNKCYGNILQNRHSESTIYRIISKLRNEKSSLRKKGSGKKRHIIGKIIT